jgi:hypothetical protein
MTEDRGLVAATRQSFEKARRSRTTFCLLSSALCLLIAGHPQADPMTAAQAFAEGKALGQGATGAAAGNITNGTIASTVNSFNPQYYQYSTTAPETQYFQGGNGDTHTPGANKITSCANDPANPDKFLQQNCDAINYMARNPTIRPQFTINPNDPMILNSRQITANAGALAAQSLGFADPSAMGSFTACQTNTTSTSPTYTTEVCNEYLSSTTNMCIVGRDVVVDAQSNFQCNETANAYETSTCDKTLSVTVTQPQPIAATPNYSCPAGQTLSGTTCVQPTIAASVNYSCSAGSTLSGSTCQPAPTTATANYSCGTGQTLSGTSCVTPAVNATLNYSCPSGGVLSGTSCTPAATSASVSYSCPAGSTLSGTSCQAPAYQPAGVAATLIYSGSSWWIPYFPSQREGGFNAAIKNATSWNSSYVSCSWFASTYIYGGYNVLCNTNVTTTYSCPSGYTLSGSTCYPPLVTPPPTAATASYSCPSGSTLSGTSCQASSYAATGTYSCSGSTTLSGSQCITPTVSATVSYSCPSGSTLSGTSCYPPPVGATVSYICPAGDTLVGTSCQPPATVAAITYTCAAGMQLSGSSCVPAPVVSSSWTNGCATLEDAAL